MSISEQATIDAISLFVYARGKLIQTQNNRTEVESMYHPEVEETIATLLQDGGISQTKYAVCELHVF